MDLLYSVFLGGGVATYAYTKMGRRLGYGNTKNVTTLVIIIFILVTIISFTIFKFTLKI